MGPQVGIRGGSIRPPPFPGSTHNRLFPSAGPIVVTHEPHSTPLFASLVPSIPKPPADLFGDPDADPSAVERRVCTSLEPDETTVGSIPPTYLSPPTTLQHDLCLSFRHSGWLARRARILATLKRAERPPPRVVRFCLCGSVAWVLRTTADPIQYRTVQNRCRDRWCTPCATEKRRVVVANIATRLDGRSLRLLTLTLKSSDLPLSCQITRILKSFAKLRRRREICRSFHGGLYFLEITYNAATHQWHPHLHVLFEGTYIAHDVLRRLWLEITGDSYIVDIRAFGNSKLAAGYVAKYATKAIASNVFDDDDRLLEAMEALHGRRTFQTFGKFTDMALSLSPETDDEWLTVGSLWSIILAARDGDPNAKAIIAALKRTNAHDPLDIQVEQSKPP